MITKQDARNKKLADRDAISLTFRYEKSKSICKEFAAELDSIAARRAVTAKRGTNGATHRDLASESDAFQPDVSCISADSEAVEPIENESDSLCMPNADERRLRLAAYEPMRSEVDVHPLLDHAYATGWQVFLPCMAKDAPEAPAHMVFFEMPRERLNADRPAFLDHPARPYLLSDLAAEGWQPADVSTFDAVAVPMVAFDNRNMRLGYGGGNYDRFLPQLRKDCFVAGVAFEEQRMEEVPTEPHDLALPHIFTA